MRQLDDHRQLHDADFVRHVLTFPLLSARGSRCQDDLEFFVSRTMLQMDMPVLLCRRSYYSSTVLTRSIRSTPAAVMHHTYVPRQPNRWHDERTTKQDKVVKWTNEGTAPTYLGLSSPLPGKVIPVDLQQAGAILTKSQMFLCRYFTQKYGAELCTEFLLVGSHGCVRRYLSDVCCMYSFIFI